MALRVIRVAFPTGSASLGSVNIVHKAGVHTSSGRSLQYGWLAYLLGDRSTPRLKHLSKIFTVEGNLASGKGAFAQKLADKLGMLYLPEPSTFYMDKIIGEKQPLPLEFNGHCSLEKFYTDPKAANGNSYRLQHWMYMMRLLQYSDAIEHMITTGQGVILERSPFSDMVFVEAMYKQGYIRQECVNHYNEIKNISVSEFLPPHLVIYIDQPAEEVQKKLKQSGKPYHQNVPLAYLKSIEDSYKKSYLPTASTTSELLAYDVAQSQDIEKVAEDIEVLAFQKGPWLEQDDVTLHHMRILVQNKCKVAALAHIPYYLQELTIGADDFELQQWFYRSLRGKTFAPGYNANIGDKYILFK